MAKFLGIALGGGIAFCGFRTIVDKTKKLSTDQHVVIVGGGYGGGKLANNLKGRGKFTLIDQRDAMHHNLAALRAAVEIGFSPKSVVPYKPTFGDNFVQGKVVDIDLKKKEVILENHPYRIPYSELVLATGCSGPFPGKCQLDLSGSEIIKLYADYAKDVQKAENIVIVGGGAVGVEMAGDIATDYPNQKKITVIHNSDALVNSTLNEKSRKILNEKFEKKNISTILNDTVVNMGDIPVNKTSEVFQVRLASGKTIDANLVIPCYGLAVNSAAYKDALVKSVNGRGQLKVNDKLQVEGTENVFAVGDCNDTDVVKLAFMALEQGDFVYNQLLKVGKGKPLQSYKPSGFKMCIPIGRDGGFTQAGNMVFGDLMTKAIKAKDVMVQRIWKEYGQTPPK